MIASIVETVGAGRNMSLRGGKGQAGKTVPVWITMPSANETGQGLTDKVKSVVERQFLG